MEFRSVNKEEHGYQILFESETGVWSIGLWRVLFGCRVIAYRRASIRRTIDYCAGDKVAFLMELLLVIKVIMEQLPESISERELSKMLPGYEVRPIDKDPCWQELQRRAALDS